MSYQNASNNLANHEYYAVHPLMFHDSCFEINVHGRDPVNTSCSSTIENRESNIQDVEPKHRDPPWDSTA